MNIKQLAWSDPTWPGLVKHNGLAITLKVACIQDNLAQILVVASGNNATQDTDYAVNGILRVCKEIGAHCRLPNE